MALNKLSIYGNINIGVYVFTNNHLALVPPNIEDKHKKIIIETLNVEVHEVKVADSALIGILIAGNDNGILLPRIVRDEEYKHIKRLLDINVGILHSRFTALGNIILTNNKVALVHPELENEAITVIKDFLGVEEVVKGTIAKLPVVGSVAVLNSKGCAVHPDASEEDIKMLEELFKVNVGIATVNFGVTFLRSGIIANDHGALVGEATTGPEMMRIQTILNV